MWAVRIVPRKKYDHHPIATRSTELQLSNLAFKLEQPGLGLLPLPSTITVQTPVRAKHALAGDHKWHWVICLGVSHLIPHSRYLGQICQRIRSAWTLYFINRIRIS